MLALMVTLALCLAPVSATAYAAGTLRDEPLLPIPLTLDLNPAKVNLGEILFNDTRLSLNNTLACASCHQLGSGGDDNRKFGAAHGDNSHIVNTPTVFNSRYNFRQNWDGSVRNIEGQIDKVVHSHLEANTNWTELISELRQDRELEKLFSSIYTEGITRNSFIDALTEFEKSLVTPNARFDRYLRGDDEAINEEEKRGYMLFKELGCISCHQGINVGGNLFQKFGIFYNYFEARGNIQNADYGRMNVTGKQTDAHVFKVPSLRNVEVTAPYLHDGNAETLYDAVNIMGKTQLGRDMNAEEVDSIVQFLKTLTGEYKNVPLQEGQS